MAEEENLALLGRTIGLELETVAQEKDVGPFRADTLCRDTATDDWVLLENQLERTDHTHLGQLLTYAAGLNAVTIVWVAQRFTDEHKAALDWLNEMTTIDVNFFGLEIELWRIGKSAIAPKLNVASAPNDWTRNVTSVTNRVVSKTSQFQLEYWTHFAEFLRDSGSGLRRPKPLPKHYVFFPARTDVNFCADIHVKDAKIYVDLYFKGDNGRAFYSLLKRDENRLEQLVGKKLKWEPRARTYSIRLYESADPLQKGDWLRQFEWLKVNLELFQEKLIPTVKELDVSDYDPENDETEE
ncbi:MAG: DUF4268 domain-containing protein [Candidatus Latescibacteria bacterium]|nr:DUF4268 domain-containing protein [Candidatus Latescibacterota bacterium]